MNYDIRALLHGKSADECRSALYYLNRYLKQAGTLDDYEKDIFEDSSDSEPDLNIRQLTKLLIDFIEKASGQNAADFNDAVYTSWVNHIMQVETELSSESSLDLENLSEEFLRKMSVPRS